MSGGRKGAISRLRKELQNFMKDPPPYLSVRPLPSPLTQQQYLVFCSARLPPLFLSSWKVMHALTSPLFLTRLRATGCRE